MELLDVYDDDGNLTGKVIVRRQGKLEKGEHVKSVHIVIRNQDNLYLIQQRSYNKNTRPGVWDITCGAVSSGEHSRKSAARETQEENGLGCDENKLIYIGQTLSDDLVFQDIFLADLKFNLSDCIKQDEEVENLKLIEKSEFIEFIKNLNHRNQEYRNLIINYITNN
jgi:8-oxo-dGTP pyrophosphatase MutT (NUDIX family)